MLPVAFVGITAYIFLVGILNNISCKLPLHTCRETAAASSSETAVEDCLDNIVRSHFSQDFCQSLIAAFSDIFVYIFRINNTAVSESNTVLFFIECCILKRLDTVVCYSFLIYQSCNNTAFEEMFFNDFRDIFNLNH